ncbi:hypothetical protein [Pseudomonas mandelii]|uniref:hypothetical protein n=1 Tax=Pseudomonas mandelii TaxID=75612 RepID=UPI0020CB9B05|nr:hypothetical protein [Pseudomonas mandelii]
MSKFFNELMESVRQMNEIISGEREPSREFHIDASSRWFREPSREFHIDASPVKENRGRSDAWVEASNRSSLPPTPDAQ